MCHLCGVTNQSNDCTQVQTINRGPMHFFYKPTTVLKYKLVYAKWKNKRLSFPEVTSGAQLVPGQPILPQDRSGCAFRPQE